MAANALSGILCGIWLLLRIPFFIILVLGAIILAILYVSGDSALSALGLRREEQILPQPIPMHHDLKWLKRDD